MSDDTMRDGAMDEPMKGGPAGGETSSSLPADCAAFDAALADYLEGTLAPAQRDALESHRAICARCDALATDLEGIVTAARSLSPIVPSAAATEAMWSAVSSRIEASTVSIDSATVRRSVAGAGTRSRFDGWRRQLVAAAALVFVTAGVTYTVTQRMERSQQIAGIDGGGGPKRPGPAGTVPPPVPVDTTTVSRSGTFATTTPGEGANGSTTTNVSTSPTGGKKPNVARPSATVTYEREIVQLRRILTERRGELDSTTVAVVEGNLAVIDMAIRQSREALARDPRSRFLGEQLNSALDKKLELLRTAALLPART